MIVMRNKQWSELSTAQKTRIVVIGAVQVSLLIAALRDIRRRSPEEIKGSKKLWTAALVVQPIGPISYFLFGRKR